MRTIRTTLATMLTGLALVAFQFDAQAQVRRSGSSQSSSSNTTSSRSSGTVSRSSGTATRSSGVVSGSSGAVSRSSGTTSRSTGTVSRSSGTTTRSTGTVSRSTGTTSRSTGTVSRSSGTTSRSTGTVSRPSGSVSRPVSGTTPTRKPSTTVARPDARPSGGAMSKPVQVTRPGVRPGDKKPGGEAMRPSLRPGQGGSQKPGHGMPQKPVQVRPDHRHDPHRVHPRDRDFMHYSAPSYFWTGHNHCYGHRVRVLPTHVHRYVHYGVTYYCYNDIWYRPYGGYYVVCRPPFGTVLAANLIADMTWAAVRLSYYYTVANTYSTINENNQHIAEQNAIIAQNNATIAAQNAQIAAGQQQAQAAYGLATQLGLVQSYAAAGSDYYYQDGVFYVMGANGEYKVIVPPAGALVETLPEDFDMVTLADGNEYYKVDDTIYRVVVIEGKPYFEVLGQLYA